MKARRGNPYDGYHHHRNKGDDEYYYDELDRVSVAPSVRSGLTTASTSAASEQTWFKDMLGPSSSSSPSKKTTRLGKPAKELDLVSETSVTTAESSSSLAGEDQNDHSIQYGRYGTTKTSSSIPTSSSLRWEQELRRNYFPQEDNASTGTASIARTNKKPTYQKSNRYNPGGSSRNKNAYHHDSDDDDTVWSRSKRVITTSTMPKRREEKARCAYYEEPYQPQPPTRVSITINKDKKKKHLFPSQKWVRVVAKPPMNYGVGGYMPPQYHNSHKNKASSKRNRQRSMPEQSRPRALDLANQKREAKRKQEKQRRQQQQQQQQRRRQSRTRPNVPQRNGPPERQETILPKHHFDFDRGLLPKFQKQQTVPNRANSTPTSTRSRVVHQPTRSATIVRNQDSNPRNSTSAKEPSRATSYPPRGVQHDIYYETDRRSNEELHTQRFYNNYQSKFWKLRNAVQQSQQKRHK